MIISGIISEYNPFHAGHLYHVNETRKQTRADYVVACMSGAFTQRGLPAFMDKFDRVKAALTAGVDAVVELPAVCAVRPAEWFARGGVSVLTSLGIDYLSFGCENADTNSLLRLFDLLQNESDDLKAAIRKGLDEGKTLARARGEALESLFPGLRNMPNLSLGLEYMASIKALGAKTEVCVIKRTSAYHSETLTDGLSASEIRRAVSSGNTGWAVEKMPDCIKTLFSEMLPESVSDAKKLDSLILHTLRNLSPEERALLPDAGEGLAERLCAKAQEADSVESLISLVKCKRYTHARITRVIAGAILKLPKTPPETAPYLRLLGFRKDASPLIREMSQRSGGMLISDAAKLEDNPAFLIEKRATDLWGLSAAGAAYRKAGRERTQKFILV